MRARPTLLLPAAMTLGAIAGTVSSALASPGNPGFATLDRISADSRLELALGSVLYDDGPDWVGRIDLHAQFITRGGGGGYASVPYSFVIDSDSDDLAALGNLELGGFYVSGGSLPVVLRAGLVLNTSEDGIDSLASLAGAFARQTDLVSVSNGQTWLRLAASPTFRTGALYVRLDAGLDVDLGDDDDSADPLIRLNLGLGLDLGGSVAATLELVNIGTTGDVNDGDDRFLQSLARGIRGLGGPWRPFLALAVPLGDSVLDAEAALIVGTQYHFD
jgi:hypothetical protein